MSRQGSYGTVVFRNAKEIIEREDVKSIVKELRDKWHIPKNGFTRKINYLKWFAFQTKRLTAKEDYSRYSIFSNEIKNCCLRLKLPSFWSIFLTKYITRGKVISSSQLRSGNSINTPRIHLDELNQKVFLEITANTKLADVESMWHKVKLKQKQLLDFDKSRTKRKLKRDLYILRKSEKAGLRPNKITANLPQNLGYITPETASKALQRIRKNTKRQ